MKSFFYEFKTFAVKGNVVDLAVGIIIGAAFNRIVSSLVTDVVMPPIGLILGRVDFSNLYLNLGGGEFETFAEAQTAGAPTINYGIFVDNVITFVVTALVIFILVRFINKIRSQNEKSPVETPTTKTCSFCFTAISIKAIRCPNCTSHLEQAKSEK